MSGNVGLPIFADDSRVTVSDTTERHYGEHGIVESWYFGMSGRPMYVVILDGREETAVFTETQLDLGESIYT